jgi:hypothetical protein
MNDPFDVFPSTEINKQSAAAIQHVRQNIGVCCFTTDPKNLVMWAHYADKHRGICLCFDFPDNQSIINPPPRWNKTQREANIAVTPQSVIYAQSRPKVAMGSNLANYLLTKYQAWGYEKEYRAFILDDAGEFNYNPIYLTGIIAGCKMPNKDLSELRKLIIGLSAPADLFITIPEHSAFRLDIAKI